MLETFFLVFTALIQFTLQIKVTGLLACIVGIRVLGDNQTDLQEARALSHRDDVISIYSNSWGPFDFGFTVEGPGPLVQRTFQIGTAEVSFDHTSCLCCTSLSPLYSCFPLYPLYAILHSDQLLWNSTIRFTYL